MSRDAAIEEGYQDLTQFGFIVLDMKIDSTEASAASESRMTCCIKNYGPSGAERTKFTGDTDDILRYESMTR